MLIMYDGTPFKGWQVQPNGVSIQQLLQEAIAVITKKNVHVIGSGRTDAGVHAIGQTANFKIGKELDLFRFLNSLNALTPDEITVKEIVKASNNFHARYSAIRKTYRYHVNLSRQLNPFERLYSWHFLERVDIALIKKAANSFIGTKDFSSFANESHAGSAAKNPVRTIYRLDVYEKEDQTLIFEVEADGFLYKMVRNIIGTIFCVGTGKMHLEELPGIFMAKNRSKAGAAAPPHGLFLFKVDY